METTSRGPRSRELRQHRERTERTNNHTSITEVNTRHDYNEIDFYSMRGKPHNLIQGHMKDKAFKYIEKCLSNTKLMTVSSKASRGGRYIYSQIGIDKQTKNKIYAKIQVSIVDYIEGEELPKDCPSRIEIIDFEI